MHGLDNSQNATKAVGAAVSVAQASPTVNMISCGSAPTGLTISVDASAGVASSSNGLAQGIEEVGNKELSTDTATVNASGVALGGNRLTQGIEEVGNIGKESSTDTSTANTLTGVALGGNRLGQGIEEVGKK